MFCRYESEIREKVLTNEPVAKLLFRNCELKAQGLKHADFKAFTAQIMPWTDTSCLHF